MIECFPWWSAAVYDLKSVVTDGISRLVSFSNFLQNFGDCLVKQNKRDGNFCLCCQSVDY